MAKQIQYEAFLKLETGTHTARINQLLVSPDQKSLITAGSDKTIRIWDIESKKQSMMLLGQIGSGPRGSIQRIAITPDGKHLAVLVWMYPTHSEDQLDRDSELRIYNLATGNLQASFQFKGTLQNVDFSPNGQFVLIVGNKRDGSKSRDGHLYIYNTKNILKGFGNLPTALAVGILHETNGLIPAYAQFIPDKNKSPSEYKIAAATWIQNGTGLVKWFSFKPSGKINLLVEKETEGLSPESLTASGEYSIITAHHHTHNKNLYCYDHSGNLLSVTPSETPVAQPAFSSDGKQLIVGQHGDSELVQVKVFTVSEGQLHLKSTYYGHDSEAVAVALLEDGTAVSAGGDQNDIHFWNTGHLEGERIGTISGVGRTIHALGINEGGQIGIGMYDALKQEDGRIVLQRLFDLQSMTLRISTIQDNESYQRSQREFGTFGLKWLDDNVNLWLTESGSPLQPITGTPHPTKPGTFIWYHPPTFGFTPNGSIITGARDGKIRVTLRETGYQTPLRLLGGGFSARVNDHAASGKWLVTGGADQIIRIWYLRDVEKPLPGDIDPDLETLSPALNLFVGSDDEWVIWSKSGYYNASQRGDRRFGYHINRGSNQEALYYPSDRFIKSFFRPDIIQSILEYGSEELALEVLNKRGKDSKKIDVSTILPPIVDVKGNGFVVSKNGKKVDIEFSVEGLNPTAPVTRVWIVQNDKFVWEKTGSKLEKSYKVILPLEVEMNRFKILAETAMTKSMPLMNSIMGPEQKQAKKFTAIAKGTKKSKKIAGLKSNGVLYILAVGVASHADRVSSVPDLKYPAVDANSIYNALGWSDFSSEKPKTGKRLNKAFREVVPILLANEQGTKNAILEQVDAVSKKIQKRAKTNPNQRDVLFVFLSGHGIPGDDASDSELYFWNYDFIQSNPQDTGLSFIEIGKRITSLPADVILATDACHSGMAGGNIVRGVDPNELAKRLYAINERGLYVLNATRSSDTAWELDKLGHGVFTWSILRALQNDADPGISMMRLMDSLQTTLAHTKRQTPVFRMYGDLLPLTIFSK